MEASFLAFCYRLSPSLRRKGGWCWKRGSPSAPLPQQSGTRSAVLGSQQQTGPFSETKGEINEVSNIEVLLFSAFTLSLRHRCFLLPL